MRGQVSHGWGEGPRAVMVRAAMAGVRGQGYGLEHWLKLTFQAGISCTNM